MLKLRVFPLLDHSQSTTALRFLNYGIHLRQKIFIYQFLRALHHTLISFNQLAAISSCFSCLPLDFTPQFRNTGLRRNAHLFTPHRLRANGQLLTRGICITVAVFRSVLNQRSFLKLVKNALSSPFIYLPYLFDYKPSDFYTN